MCSPATLALGVDMVHAVTEPHFDADLLESTRCGRGERLGKRCEHTLACVDEDDPR
jgi:hypothetical protein